MELKVVLFLLFQFISFELNVANSVAVNSTSDKHGETNKSVVGCKMFEIESEMKPCDLRLFNESTVPLTEVTSVEIVQKDLVVKRGVPSLCEIFPNIRSLELNFEYLTEHEFINCEFDLLDNLTIGGKLLDKTLERPLKNLLKKNTRIQQITFKGPTNHRTYQLVKKYLKNLQEVWIYDKIAEDDEDQEEIFMPNVRKLKIHLNSQTGCHPPMSVIFGDKQLKELDLYCDENDKNYKYFSTLYRYPNVKSLSAGNSLTDRELVKMSGIFPKLKAAHFTFNTSVKANTISEFISKSDQLEQLSFHYPNDANQTEMVRAEIKERLKTISDQSGINVTSPNDSQLDHSEPSTSTILTSGLTIYLIGLHIYRAFFC